MDAAVAAVGDRMGRGAHEIDTAAGFVDWVYDWVDVPAWCFSPFTVRLTAHTVTRPERLPSTEVAAPGWLRYVWTLPRDRDEIPILQRHIEDALFVDDIVPFWVTLRVFLDSDPLYWRVILQMPLGSPGVREFVRGVDQRVQSLRGTKTRESMSTGLRGRWSEAAESRSRMSAIVLFTLLVQTIGTFWMLSHHFLWRQLKEIVTSQQYIHEEGDSNASDSDESVERQNAATSNRSDQSDRRVVRRSRMAWARF